MEYFYAGMCALVGLVLILKMRKENKIFLPIGAFVFLFGLWLVAKNLLGEMLSVGVFWYIEKIVLGAMAIILILILIKENKKSKTEEK